MKNGKEVTLLIGLVIVSALRTMNQQLTEQKPSVCVELRERRTISKGQDKNL
jgi:hypothetical protein